MEGAIVLTFVFTLVLLVVAWLLASFAGVLWLWAVILILVIVAALFRSEPTGWFGAGILAAGFAFITIGDLLAATSVTAQLFIALFVAMFVAITALCGFEIDYSRRHKE